ncbi:MAG TPA: PQQ-dependent sugar dehydrogenase [Spirochaetia bacterium]|nr:PQQ-dependent sugar dehydrogenase [Spirochaetia bacterium]
MKTSPVAAIGILLLLGCAAASVAQDATPAQNGPPAPLPFPLHVPEGFSISLVSDQIRGARFLAVAPNGDVLVSLISRGQVVAIHPGDRVSAPPQIVANGLSRPNGVAFRGDDLYIATWTGVVRIRNYGSGNRRIEVLFDDMPRNGGHTARAIALANDGTIYVSSGSTCNVCTENDPRLATILRYSPGNATPGGAGTYVGAIYARGLRNASGLALDDTGQLWAVVNQRDNLTPSHDNLPPDELDRVVEGANYGWPYCYPIDDRRVPNPEFPGAVCGQYLPTSWNFQAHSAPLQALYYPAPGAMLPDDESAFPAEFRGSLFAAFHGSWNRQPPTGYKVIVVHFKDGRPAAEEDFVTGWLTADNRVLGRPVGIAVAADGSLYVSDDTGLLFRVSYKAR